MFRIDAAKHMDRIVDVLEIYKSSPPTNQLNSPGLVPKAVDLRQINSEEKFGRHIRKRNLEEKLGREIRKKNSEEKLWRPDWFYNTTLFTKAERDCTLCMGTNRCLSQKGVMQAGHTKLHKARLSKAKLDKAKLGKQKLREATYSKGRDILKRHQEDKSGK